MGKNEGVHNLHTLGFGSGRTGAGLGRIAEVCGGVAELHLGLRPVRNFRSDTCSCRNAGERHDMATDPEQIIWSLSLARW